MGIIPAEMRSLMDWFQKLERKYSKYAIQNLMMYIIVLYAVGFVFEVFAAHIFHWILHIYLRDRYGGL